ncbi:MAG: hypothetical protein ABIJ39_08425 [Chloroflexota bacterium]
MAWLALVIVTLAFFAPGIGIGPSVAAHDIALPITLSLMSFAVNIPFTGPLRLFASCAGTWLILWQAFFWLDRWLKADFLRRIGLYNDLIYASRPPRSLGVAVFLAKATLWVLVVKAVLIVLLRLAVNFLVPYLSTLSWIPADILPWVTDIVTQGWINLLGLSSNWNVSLFILGVLVLIVNRAFEWEKRGRYYQDVRHNQDRRRNHQKDIVIPATQA